MSVATPSSETDFEKTCGNEAPGEGVQWGASSWGFSGTDCSKRVNHKSGLRYGDIISLKVHRPSFDELNPDERWSDQQAFVSTLQNPLLASTELQALTTDEITRPFSLVATFEICAADDNENDQPEDLAGAKLLFGDRLRLKHCGSGNWLMIDMEKRASRNPLCATAFLSSSKSLNPTPQRAEARMRIIPKLKSTNEARSVAGNDIIKLEFVNNHFLNVTFAETRESVSCELNGLPSLKGTSKTLRESASNDSCFSVTRFHQAPLHTESSVRIGDVVRIYHAENEGFLTAAGSREDKKVCVHHESKRAANGEMESGDSNRLFVVTNPSLMRREYGGVLKPSWKDEPGDCFRLLNLASSMYLTIDSQVKYGSNGTPFSSMRLCQRDDHDMSRSYFKLIDLEDDEKSHESIDAKFGSYYCLASAHNGPMSQVQVSAMRVGVTVGNKGMVAKAVSHDQVLDAESKGLDSAQLYPHSLCNAYRLVSPTSTGLLDQVQREEVFRFNRAEASLAQDIIFATSMIHYLETFTHCILSEHDFLRLPIGAEDWGKISEAGDRSAHPKQRRQFDQVVRALSRLTLGCMETSKYGMADVYAEDGEPISKMQQLFLDHGVTQTVVHLLEVVTTDLQDRLVVLATRDDYRLSHSVVTLCWRFLKQACKKYPPAGKFIVELSLDLMICHQPLGVRVIETLVEAFHDNAPLNSLVDNTPFLQDKLISFAVSNIEEVGRVADFLDMLSNVCSDLLPGDSEETLYAHSCEAVTKALQAHPRLIMPRRYTASKRIEIDVSLITDSRPQWIDLEELKDTEFVLSTHLLQKAKCTRGFPRPVPSLQYLRSTLLLLTRLCTPDSLDRIRLLVPAEEALQCVVNANLDVKLRARYCNLLSNLHVGVPAPDASLTHWVHPRPREEPTGACEYWPELLAVLKHSPAYFHSSDERDEMLDLMTEPWVRFTAHSRTAGLVPCKFGGLRCFL